MRLKRGVSRSISSKAGRGPTILPGSTSWGLRGHGNKREQVDGSRKLGDCSPQPKRKRRIIPVFSLFHHCFVRHVVYVFASRHVAQLAQPACSVCVLPVSTIASRFVREGCKGWFGVVQTWAMAKDMHATPFPLLSSMARSHFAITPFSSMGKETRKTHSFTRPSYSSFRLPIWMPMNKKSVGVPTPAGHKNKINKNQIIDSACRRSSGLHSCPASPCSAYNTFPHRRSCGHRYTTSRRQARPCIRRRPRNCCRCHGGGVVVLPAGLDSSKWVCSEVHRRGDRLARVASAGHGSRGRRCAGGARGSSGAELDLMGWDLWLLGYGGDGGDDGMRISKL